MWDFSDSLSRLEAQGLLRRPVPVTGVDRESPWLVRVGDRVAALFCGNDYLGLRLHPEVLEAAAQAAKQFGPGSGAARQVAGDWPPLRDLENEIASWLGTESALLFSSGYLANLGALSALAEEGDILLSDEKNHASLIDGCRLSRARTVVYRHADLDDLERRLRAHPGRRRIVVSESLFGMDGDLAPLDELRALQQRHEFAIYLDEAHSLGTLDWSVRGVSFRMGTLSKALGSQGAFLAGEKQTIEILRNQARTYLFDTALSPVSAAAALAAIRCLRKEPERTARLQERAGQLRQALDPHLPAPPKRPITPILPLLVGDPQTALGFSQWLLERGIYAQAIRPPTVAAGSSRLRVTVSAAHPPAEIERLAKTLLEARRLFPWSY